MTNIEAGQALPMKCACCGEVKPCPLRRDDMGGYVCLTCVDAELSRRPAPVGEVREPSNSTIMGVARRTRELTFSALTMDEHIDLVRAVEQALRVYSAPQALPDAWLIGGMPVKISGHTNKGRVADVDPIGRRVYVDFPAGGGRWCDFGEVTPWEAHRDVLGRIVRDAWIKWATKQPSPKPSWLAPYDDLSEPDKEADRQIGEALVGVPPVPSTGTEEVRAAVLEEAGVKALREFAESFHITVVANAYSDVTLHLDKPHALSIRLTNQSDKSWLFQDFEDRRVAAIRNLSGKQGDGQ